MRNPLYNAVALQKIIAAYTIVSFEKIDLSKILKDGYIPSSQKNSFATDVVTMWPKLDSTNIHNEMFATLKTGIDILSIINKIPEL